MSSKAIYVILVLLAVVPLGAVVIGKLGKEANVPLTQLNPRGSVFERWLWMLGFSAAALLLALAAEFYGRKLLVKALRAGLSETVMVIAGVCLIAGLIAFLYVRKAKGLPIPKPRLSSVFMLLCLLALSFDHLFMLDAYVNSSELAVISIWCTLFVGVVTVFRYAGECDEKWDQKRKLLTAVKHLLLFVLKFAVLMVLSLPCALLMKAIGVRTILGSDTGEQVSALMNLFIPVIPILMVPWVIITMGRIIEMCGVIKKTLLCEWKAYEDVSSPGRTWLAKVQFMGVEHQIMRVGKYTELILAGMYYAKSGRRLVFPRPLVLYIRTDGTFVDDDQNVYDADGNVIQRG